MAIKLLWDHYQTFQITGQQYNFSPSGLSVNTVTLDAATGVTSYDLSSSLGNVQSVLLIPDINYVYELNHPGVGGVYTTLRVTPTGGISGLPVTETVKVGSFAYLGTAASIEIAVRDYLINHRSSANDAAYVAIDSDIQHLLQGVSPSLVSSQVQSHIASADAALAQIAQPLVNIAANWNNPIYTLDWGSGSSTSTGTDPAAFGVDLIAINGAFATWSVNGVEGGITVSGYTAYSTYDNSTFTITVNIQNANAAGELDIASTNASGQQPRVVVPKTPLSTGDAAPTLVPFANGNFLINSGSLQQLYNSSGVLIGTTQTYSPSASFSAGSTHAVTELQLAGGNYVTITAVNNQFFANDYNYAISTNVNGTGVVVPTTRLITSTFNDNWFTQASAVAATASGGFAVASQLNQLDANIGRWLPALTNVSAYNATGTRLWSVNLAGNGIEALAALPNGNIVVETFLTGQQNTGQITVFDSAGHSIAQSGLAGAVLGSATITTLQNGGFVAAWNDGQIESQIYDSSGHAVGAKIQVSPTGENVGGANNAPSNLAIASLKNGNYVVVWGVDIPSTGALPNNYLRGQVYDAQGHTVGDNFIFATGVNLENNFPEIAALANGSFVVTWIQQPTAPGAGVFGPQEEIFALPGTLFPNHAPTITTTTVTTTADQPIPLSSLFQASDADGDALTYAIYDGTPGANTGHFVVAGSVIAAGVAVNLTAAQLAQTTFVAGATGVTDDIRVIAYDRHDYSGGGLYTQLHVNVSVVTQPPPNDFNLDARSDMLLRNDAGVVVNWEMNNAALLRSNSFGTVPFNWHILGVNDFSGDGRADILWRNDAGAVQTWDINGGTLTGTHSLGVIPANWHIIGTGDFNGDHNADILWRNDANNMVAIWNLANSNLVASKSLGVVSGNWHIAGTADFNADGKTDILWQNDAGFVQTWHMNNDNLLAVHNLGAVPANWHIIGTGDFNGDRNADILWQNDAGVVTIWDLSDGNLLASKNVGVLPSSWHVVDTGDYNGDQKTDILLHNDGGATTIWDMNDNNILSSSPVGNVPANWHIIV